MERILLRLKCTLVDLRLHNNDITHQLSVQVYLYWIIASKDLNI
jgi:hypothetical protein